MEVELTSDFLKTLKSLSSENQKAVERTLNKLRKDHISHSVNLRPLKGSRGYWIVNVSRKYRIISKKYKKTRNGSENVLRLLYVGSHDTTYNWSNR